MISNFKLDPEETGYCVVPINIVNKSEIINNTNTEIGIYVPKLMPYIEMKDKAYIDEVTVQSTVIVNDKDTCLVEFPKKIKVCNFIRSEWESEANRQPSVIECSEKCKVLFHNNDIKRPYYRKEMSQYEKRYNDIYHIKVPNTHPDDPGVDYELNMDTVNKEIKILATPTMTMTMREKEGVINVTHGTRFITIDNDRITVQSGGITSTIFEDELIHHNSKVIITDAEEITSTAQYGHTINGTDVFINGENIESVAGEYYLIKGTDIRIDAENLTSDIKEEYRIKGKNIIIEAENITLNNKKHMTINTDSMDIVGSDIDLRSSRLSISSPSMSCSLCSLCCSG